MQKEFIKNIYKEFVYCDPKDHLLNPNNTLTRPETTSKHMLNKVSPLNKPQFVTIQSEITGDNNNSEITLVTPTIETVEIQKPPLNAEIKKKTTVVADETACCASKIPQDEVRIPKEPIIYSEEVFNQIELRGFITKDLLRMSLDKGSNLFHIAEDIFEKLVDRYNQFKEILHTLETEFDNTVECIIETGKELGKKINHIIYQLYLAIMERRL